MSRRIMSITKISGDAVTDNSKLSTHLRLFWSVTYFSRTFVKNAVRSSVLDSPSFEMYVGSIKTVWLVRLYPNGNDKLKNCVGIQLVKLSELTKNYEYSCRFTIMKDDKEMMSKEFKARPAGNEKLREGYGFMLFISHGELFHWFDKYIDGSRLVIRADIVLSTSKIGDEEDDCPTTVVLDDVHCVSSLGLPNK